MALVGQKIHALRKAKGLTLKQVSDLSGRSVSFLSQVERNLTSPTVTSLAQIAHALGVGASYFFTPPPREGQVVRSYAHQPFRLEDGEVVYARLGAEFEGRTLEPLLVAYPPHFASETSSHEGEEFLYLLEGQVMIFLEEQEYTLNPGDSMHFASRHTHRVVNPCDVPARILFVNTPKYLD